MNCNFNFNLEKMFIPSWKFVSYKYCAEVFQKPHGHAKARKLWATEAEMDSPIDLHAKAPKNQSNLTFPRFIEIYLVYKDYD